MHRNKSGNIMKNILKSITLIAAAIAILSCCGSKESEKQTPR